MRSCGFGFWFGFGRGVQGWSGGLVDLAVGILVSSHRAAVCRVYCSAVEWGGSGCVGGEATPRVAGTALARAGGQTLRERLSSGLCRRSRERDKSSREQLGEKAMKVEASLSLSRHSHAARVDVAAEKESEKDAARMLYAAQAQPPTAQLSAVQCRLFSPTRSALVVNKLDRIECSELQDDDAQSLVLVCTVPVHGAVAAIQPVHLPHHDTASLVVLTTSLRLFVLARAADQPYTLETVSSISIEEPFGRLDDYQSILVDPQTRCLAVHAYAGLLRVIPLVEPATAARSMHVEEPANDDDNEDQAEVAAYPDGPINLDHNFSVRLPSLLNVHCLAFVNSDSGMAPILACIHTDHTGSRVLTSIRLDLAEKDVLPGPLEPQTLTDQGSEVIIPVVVPRSLLIVGENTITCVRVPTSTAGGSGDRSSAAGQPSGGGAGGVNRGKRRASSSAGLPTSPTGRTTASPHGWLTRPLPVARITA